MKINELLNQKRISKLEESIYTVLSKENSLTVKKVATILKRPVESINRSVNSLINKGFVRSIGKYPMILRVIPIEIALSQSLPFLNNLISSEISQNIFPFTFLPSRQIYHQAGQNLFSKVRKEVLLIASGTGNLTPEYFRTITQQINVGVKYKMIVLSKNEFNKILMENWQKNGIEIRYKKGEGFNLSVYDRKTIQLGIRILNDSNEKWGLVIQNNSLAEFMGEFFDDMWKRSKPI